MFQSCMTRLSHLKTKGLGFVCESLGKSLSLKKQI